jgi:hypothetical protein
MLKNEMTTDLQAEDLQFEPHFFDPDSVSLVILWWIKSTALLTAY